MLYLATLVVPVRMTARQMHAGNTAQLDEVRSVLEGSEFRTDVAAVDILTIERLLDCVPSSIDPDDGGRIECTVTCDALVVAPFDGEVVDVVITTVNATGVFASAGAFDVDIGVNGCLPMGYRYDGSRAAFLAKPGDARAPIEVGRHARVRIVTAGGRASQASMCGFLRRHGGGGTAGVRTDCEYLGVLERRG
jgi:DNA-directed RNA polymerase subunit E'/Rpb7